MSARAQRFPGWLIAAAIFMLAFITGVGAWYFLAERGRLQEEAEAQLTAVGNLKVHEISQWRRERLGDALALSRNPFLAQAVRAAGQGAGPGAGQGGPVAELIRALKEAYGYHDVLVVDPSGRLLASASGSAERLSGEEVDAITSSFEGGAPRLTDLFRDPPGTPVRLSAIAPILPADRRGPAGAIVLRVDPWSFLYPLIQSWPTPSTSAETLLVRREGREVVYLNELRFRPGAALTLRLPATQQALPAAAAVRGTTGVVHGIDYRQHRVVAAVQDVPESGWFIVAKQDEAEVLAAWRMRSALVLALLAAFLLAGLGALTTLWQRNETARFRQLLDAEAGRRESEERYRVTLMSVGDGVVATTADGRVSLMNPAAEKLTGWPQDQALGRPLAEVFNIVEEGSRERVENPLARVGREGRVVGLANHTLLIARNGSERPIADSGAPIVDDQGTMTGMVLVFRDVDEERRHDSEREITVQLLRVMNDHNSIGDLVREVTRLLQAWTGCEAVGIRLKEGDDYPYFETRGFAADFVEAESFLCERTLDGEPVRDQAGNPILQCMCGAVLRGVHDPARPFFTERGSFWSNSTTRLLATTTEAERMGRTRNRCNARGYESVALVRLKSGDEVLGLLQLNDRAEGRFDLAMMAFLESAADQVAIALSQRRAEAAVRVSEEHYRNLFANMLNGFAFCEMIFQDDRPVDFVYREVNEAFSRLTGLSGAEGRRVTELIPGIRESDPQLFEIYGRVVRTGIPERFETYVESMGTWFSVSAYRPRAGHFVAVFEVITQRKRAEAGRLLLESAISQTADMVIITDAQARIQYVNPAFTSVSGYTAAEVVGKNAGFIKSGEHDRAFYNELWSAISRGRTWTGRFRNRRKDGSLFWVDATVSPVRDDQGRIVNYVAASRDRTRELQLEEQLQQAQKMESVGRLAGGVAHDFNNMLQVITTCAEMSLRDLPPDKPVANYLRQIQAAARRSEELTGQLLAFARKQTYRPRVVSLADAVEGSLKMLRRLIGEDIELAWQPRASTGLVRLDPSQLSQVLANLAVNARDAIGGVGRITIETDEVHFDEAYAAGHAEFTPGRYMMLAVSDDGCGMDRTTMSHLFEPFFTTKPVGKGTGLGLATVYGVVRQNRGFINVYSEPGSGTTFRIYLPRVEAEPITAAAEAAPEQALPRGSETVLMVEDEKSILDLGAEALSNLGYRVLAAQTPEEALMLAAAHAGQIQLLISDVVMPQMNGKELSRRLLKSQPDMKCLYTSGYTADVIARQGVLEEGVAFLPKPFAIADLARRVRDLLDEAKGTGS